MPMWTGTADYRIEVESSLLVSSAYFGQVALHDGANLRNPRLASSPPCVERMRGKTLLSKGSILIESCCHSI